MAVRGIMLGFPLSATPDYGRAQQSTAAAEKSAGRRSFVVVQKIKDLQRLESSSRHGARKRWVASRFTRTDLTALAVGSTGFTSRKRSGCAA